MAGQFARIMSIAFLFALAMAPLHMALIVVSNLRLQLVWETGRLAAFVCAWIYIVHYSIPPLTAVAIHSAVMIAANAVFIFLADRALRQNEHPIAQVSH